MRRIGLKLSALTLGFMIGVGNAALTESGQWTVDSGRKEPAAVSIQPGRGYDFFNKPEITATWTPDPVPVLKQTYCHDPKILPIWRAIRRDRESREMLNEPAETPNCADMFRIKDVDLNGDGKSEVLVRGWGAQLCGATGNCRFWVFEKTGKSYRMLLDKGDNGELSKMGQQVRPTRTKGYADLLVKGHFSAAETNFTYYKFNDGKYIESRCQYEVPDYRDYHGEDSPRKRRFISCREFDESLKQ